MALGTAYFFALDIAFFTDDEQVEVSLVLSSNYFILIFAI